MIHGREHRGPNVREPRTNGWLRIAPRHETPSWPISFGGLASPLILACSLLGALPNCTSNDLGDASLHPPAEESTSKGTETSFSPSSVGPPKPEPNPEMIGVVIARETITIGSKHAGQIAHVHVQSGQRVRKGDRLATLAPTDADAQVDLERAREREVEASLTRASFELRRAQQVARETHGLFQRGAVSADALREAELARDSAASERKRLVARLGEQEILVRHARHQRQETEIVASEDGWISARFVEPGSILSPGTAVVRLLSTAPTFHLRYSADPTQPPSIGDIVQVRVEGPSTETLHAKVTHIAPDVDPLTQLLIVRAESTHPHDLAPGTALVIQSTAHPPSIAESG